MIEVKFKNLEKSEIIKTNVEDRMELLIEKFPDLTESKIQVTLEMENSPIKAGPDLFKVKLFVKKGRYNGIAINKQNANLYIALADLVDHMLERLNRFGDKVRVKEISKARKLQKKFKIAKEEAYNEEVALELVNSN